MRPYKGFSNILMRLSDSNSNYHSMQVYANKRKGRMNFTVSYTLAKVLTDASGNGDNPEGYQDRHYNYGPASFDRHHAFVTTYSYQIPFFQGSNGFTSNPVVKGVFAGWQLSGITRYQTGAPLTVTANTSIGSRRADYLGGEVLAADPGPNGWLNAAAFASAPDTRRGNSSVGIARGPDLYLWDFSIRKNFSMAAVHEGLRLQFQADMFNAFNRVNLKNSANQHGECFLEHGWDRRAAAQYSVCAQAQLLVKRQ